MLAGPGSHNRCLTYNFRVGVFVERRPNKEVGTDNTHCDASSGTASYVW